MTPADRSEYLKLAAELAGIATRLKALADEADRTEATDHSQRFVCEALVRLLAPSYLVAKASLAIREEAEK